MVSGRISGRGSSIGRRCGGRGGYDDRMAKNNGGSAHDRRIREREGGNMAPPQVRHPVSATVPPSMESPTPASWWKALACVLGFALVSVVPEYLTPKTYLSGDGWSEVRDVVFFPSFLAWWAIYLSSISSRFRVVATIGCVIILGIWLTVTVRKQHRYEKRDDVALCERADFEARDLRLSGEGMAAETRRLYWDYLHRAHPGEKPKRSPKKPLTQEEFLAAMTDPEYAAAYQTLNDENTKAFVQESPTLLETSSAIRKRLHQKESYSDLDLAVNGARNRPQDFPFGVMIPYAADYLNGLSRSLCPVESKFNMTKGTSEK
jgi:hypothetical protein